MPLAFTTIVIDPPDGTKPAKIVDPAKVYTVPDAYVVFFIENNDGEAHTVSVPTYEFKKTKNTDPANPIHLVAIHSVDVAANDTAAIVLHVKDKKHFKKEKQQKKKKKNAAGNSFTYKYTIFASGLKPLDPQIEINN